jgi:hypothetical protein
MVALYRVTMKPLGAHGHATSKTRPGGQAVTLPPIHRRATDPQGQTSLLARYGPVTHLPAPLVVESAETQRQGMPCPNGFTTEKETMRHLAAMLFLVLAIPAFALAAEKPMEPAAIAASNPAAAKDTQPQWKIKLAGVVPVLKFTAKDFEDLGPIRQDNLDSLWSEYRFGCSIGRVADAKAPRLDFMIERCTTPYGAQKLVAQALRNAYPDGKYPKPDASVLWGDVGDARFVLPFPGNPPAPAPQPVTLVFSRNNVCVHVYGWDGEADLKWLAGVAARIDKALAAAVADPGKLPPHKPLPGLVPALQFTEKDFADLGQVKAAGVDGPSKDVFRIDTSFVNDRSPTRCIEVWRHPSAAEARKAYEAEIRVVYAIMGFLDDADAISMADIGDARQVRHELVSAAYVSTGPWDVIFLRNNVVVRVNSRDHKGPDAAVIARRIDQQLVKWLVADKDAPAEKPAEKPAPAAK